jgi:23S rRNA (pseudouridine1915-N3)-methyltransferase
MIRIVACGHIKEKWLKDGIQEYFKRITAYDKIEIVEVDDEKTPDEAPIAIEIQIKRKEGEKILKRIKDDEYVILLDLKGKELDSVGLAQKLEQLNTNGKSKITFVIGGSHGVSDELIARSDFRWKLSSNTFPHQLCRLVVIEQIYRAFRIRRNEPYHK